MTNYTDKTLEDLRATAGDPMIQKLAGYLLSQRQITRELELQIRDLKGAVEVANENTALWKKDLDESNRLIGELRAALGTAIQYIEHHSFGHNRNEETLEVQHDITCAKCVALKIYFDSEKKETEMPKCDHRWTPIETTPGAVRTSQCTLCECIEDEMPTVKR